MSPNVDRAAHVPPQAMPTETIPGLVDPWRVRFACDCNSPKEKTVLPGLGILALV